jgi:hypothetical protein
MARLRQLHPANYGFPGNTSDDFENVVRYLNAAELGNRTLAELMAVLFDGEGHFRGPVEFRVDPLNGLQFRVGDYNRACIPETEAGWSTLVAYEDLRGSPGSSCGLVAQPLYSNRVDAVATDGQTVVPAGINADTTPVVYKNGLLKTEAHDYTIQISATLPSGLPAGISGVVFTAPLVAGDRITVFLVLSDKTSAFRRQDYDIAAPTAVLAFTFSAAESLSIYLNGVLQREGSSADYVLNQASGTIMFVNALVASDRVSIVVLDNTTRNAVVGLMLAEQFVDPLTGFIRGNRVQFDDEGIPPIKVTGLHAALTIMASSTLAATEPNPPTQFWFDTGANPARLMYWDGTRYLPSSGDLNLPVYTAADARTFLQVNGTGTALVWGAPDLSGYLRKTEKGAASGVASLDSQGRIPSSQLPNPRNRRTIWKEWTGTVSANDVHVHTRIFMEKGQIAGVTARLGAGTGSIQMSVDNIDVGSVIPVSVTTNDSVLGAVVPVDGTTVASTIKFKVTAAAAASNLDIGIVFETVG